MKADVYKDLEDLAGQVDALKTTAYRIVDALDDYRHKSVATYIVDRLDLVKAAIKDAQDWPTADASTGAGPDA